MSDSITYKDAGVNLEAAEESTDRIKKLVRRTFNKNVITDVGLFGGLFNFEKDKYKEPVLVSSADGVGTKLKIAFMSDRHNTVGQCLVNHCVDDILSQGARPLFFLDYFATGKLEPDVIAGVVEGLALACEQNGCALVGGETAEMPDFYTEGEYDIAGFIVGVVDREKIIDGSKLAEGDVIFGLPSTGFHTNGYSLARKIFFDKLGHKVDDYLEETGKTVGETLLEVHKSYLKTVSPLLDKDLVHGIAHITGGGLEGNVQRIIPDGLTAEIETNSWKTLPVFDYIEKKGGIKRVEMFRVFNMGIGMTVFVPEKAVADAKQILNDMSQEFYIIGSMKKGAKKVTLKGI
ncbi:MAG: phosphoribosylformylglycinamidine cyclo-ligase [Acidobacteria bacterium]|nr:phosphoribosylformylglycinamidine cyclo-ligase [Acidobacteriota bacterium]